jgi:hypothetical protein
LPVTPALEIPDNGTSVAADEFGGDASIDFRWTSRVHTMKYHIQISNSEYFITRVDENRSLPRADWNGKFPPGRYFWRVRGVSDNGLPGPFSEIRQFTVRPPGAEILPEDTGKRRERPSGPPVNDLDIEVINTMVIVSGKTNEGAKVSVNGVSAAMEQGSFRAVINFNRAGEHNVRIISINPGSNAETIIERKVEIRF